MKIGPTHFGGRGGEDNKCVNLDVEGRVWGSSNVLIHLTLVWLMFPEHLHDGRPPSAPGDEAANEAESLHSHILAGVCIPLTDRHQKLTMA